MSDYDVMRMLEALMGIYKAEKMRRAPRNFRLSDVERLCMDAVQSVCEWRLGRAGLPGGVPWSTDQEMEHSSVDEILLCLTRVLKSAKRWNKDGGRQGYLNFGAQFV